MKNIIEICCGSYEDAYNAYLAGAKRIELNSALHLGGLTPSLASLILTKKNTDLKVICMVRPRGAGFCYSDKEFDVMKEDVRLLMENGADGIAFGCLDKMGNIQSEQTQEIVSIIKQYQGEAVFHRAFDCVNDPIQSIELLIELSIDRVLTSGLKPKAMQGKDLIKMLQKKYGTQIEILAGSGINSQNAKEMIEYTGIHQVHSSCKMWETDFTTAMHDVSFAFMTGEHELDYDIVSQDLVSKIIASVDDEII